MALIKIDNYILQNAIGRYISHLEYGRNMLQSYVTETLSKTRLTLWDKLRKTTVFSKAFGTSDIADIIPEMLEMGMIEHLSYSALYHSNVNVDRVLDIAAISESQAKSIYVDGWEYGFIKTFASEEYQALLEKPEHVH